MLAWPREQRMSWPIFSPFAFSVNSAVTKMISSTYDLYSQSKFSFIIPVCFNLEILICTFLLFEQGLFTLFPHFFLYPQVNACLCLGRTAASFARATVSGINMHQAHPCTFFITHRTHSTP